MKRKATRFLGLCLSAAVVMSAFGLMPEKTVQAAETDYTYTAFEDDFSDAAASSEKWSQSPDIRDGKLTVPTGVLYNVKDKQFDNAVYEMDVSLNSQGSDDWIGLLFNRTSPEDRWDNSGCMVYLRGNNNAGALDVMGMDADYKVEDHKIPDYSAGESVHLKIYQEDGNIEISANDTLILTAETTSTDGYAGIYISSNSGSTSGTLDNVVIKTTPPVQDSEEEMGTVFNKIKEGLDNSVIYIDSDQISGLPLVSEEGYSFSMVKSSDESVVTAEGKVIPPSEEKEVTVTYELKYEFSGEVVKSEEYAVDYTVKEKTTSADIAHFLDDKYGLFVHYVWAGQRRIGAGGQPEQISARYPDGTKAQTIDEMIENFDAEQFAQDCEDMGMQYVIFTVWHYGMNPVYPSEVYKEWRTHEEGDLPSDDGQHDLIDKIYQELDKKGIDLYLYTHPYDIHDFYQEDKEKFNYKYAGDLTFNYDLYNDYLNEQYKELCKRYKGKIKGMFLDEGLANPANNLSVDYPRLRDTVKSVDPSLLMMQNEYNGKYSCDTSMWELPTAWHGGNYNDLGSWQTNTIPIGTSVGNIYQGYSWWAIKNRGGGTQGLETAENAYIYTVLEVGTNTEGGGIAWAAGPYCGINQEGSDTAGLWEDGVKDTLVQVYKYMKPVEEAIKNTRPSKSYVTPAYSTINTVEWGVATESADGKTTYLHVLKAPEGDTLQIAAPADGKVFAAASLLATGESVELVQDEKGITLTLPEGTQWDELNTVIKLTTDRNSGLQSALKSAQKLLDSSVKWMYSSDTEADLKAAVEAAQAVLEDNEATDEQIAEAAEKIRNAIEAHKKTYVTDSVSGENYAAGKSASASSSLEGSGFGVDYLTDANKLGEENRGWTSDPHSETPDKTEWVQIDLGEVKKIGRVDLTPCTDAGWGFPEDFKIEVSENGETYEEVFSTTGYKSDGSVFQAHFAALNARYVKITGTKLRPDQEGGQSYRMQFSEVEVYPMSVEEAAYRIDSVQQPEKGAEKINLPEAPKGFTVSGIAYTSDASIIAEDGTIYTPDKNTSVEVQFTVVRNSDQASALTRTLSITVKGSDDEDDGSVSKKTLEALLNTAKGYVEDGTVDGLIESVQKLFDEAIDEGEKVMAKEDASEEEVRNAEIKLLNAIGTIDFVIGDKEDLEMALEIAREINLEYYVEKGQAEYLTAVENAEKVLESSDVLQDEVDEAWRALVQAMVDLRLKADKSVLEDLVNKAAQIDVQKYTDKSVKAFQAVLAEAENILKDATLSVDDQKLVDQSAKELENAMDKLVLKDSENAGGSGENDKSDSDNADSQKDNNKGSSETARRDVPQTGDSAGGLYAAAAFAAVSGGVLFGRLKKRKK